MSRIKYLGDLKYQSDLPKTAIIGDTYWVKNKKHYYIYNGKWEIINEDRD